MRGVGRKIIPEMLEVDAFAAMHEGDALRRRTT